MPCPQDIQETATRQAMEVGVPNDLLSRHIKYEGPAVSPVLTLEPTLLMLSRQCGTSRINLAIEAFPDPQETEEAKIQLEIEVIEHTLEYLKDKFHYHVFDTSSHQAYIDMVHETNVRLNMFQDRLRSLNRK